MFYVKHIHIDSAATLAAQTFSTTPTDDYIVSVDNMIVRKGDFYERKSKKVL